MKVDVNELQEQVTRLQKLTDAYERGLISTPYTRALVDQAANMATQRYMEVIRLNRVVARQSRAIKRMRAVALEELAAWRELYDHVVTGVPVVPSRYPDPKLHAVAKALEAKGEAYPHDVPFDTVRRVVRALTWLGVSTPSSQEEQAARAVELVNDLCREVVADRATPKADDRGGEVEAIAKELDAYAADLLDDEVESPSDYQIATALHDQAALIRQLSAAASPRRIGEVELIVGERDDTVLTITTTVGEVRRFRQLSAAGGEPVAWLKRGGKVFVDTAHVSKAHADRSAENDKGAEVVPLYALSAAAHQDNGVTHRRTVYRSETGQFSGETFAGEDE